MSVRTIAFYLPQFHPIPENDEWWGEGFTEWTNVRSAKRYFETHHHPRVPTTLGEYDLRDVQVMHDQSELAKAHGIDGFCFYYYWFAGKRLLEAPIENYLNSGPDFPFCISWANENWSRRWDGKEHELLISQDYTATTAAEVFSDFSRYLADPRYIKNRGRPVIVVHRADHIPNTRDFVSTWRDEAVRMGLGELYLIAAETRPNLDPRALGFDAVAEFPPVGANTLASAQLMPPSGLDPAFRGRLMSYPRAARRFMRRRAAHYRRHPGVMPGWDNTARRGINATVYTGATPELYQDWLRSARAKEESQPGEGIVFVNAWNEWAEGAYLEPDALHGDAYLHATSPTPDKISRSASANRKISGRIRYAWVRSLFLAAAASLLNVARRTRDALTR